MDTELLEEMLHKRSTAYTRQGFGQDQALDMACGDFLQAAEHTLCGLELFCYRLFLTGARRTLSASVPPGLVNPGSSSSRRPV